MAARGGEPRAADPQDGPLRADRRLEGTYQADRRLRPDAARAELVRRKPDPRRGPRLGQPGRALHPRAAPSGHRGAHHPLHRARGHGDPERTGPGRRAAARGRAGGAPARGDARRARTAAAEVSPRSPRRSGGCCPSEHRDVPLRGGRERDVRRELGRARRRARGRHADARGGRERDRAGAPDGPAGSIDDYATASGSIGDHMRELGVSAAVGCPIIVDGGSLGHDGRCAAPPRAAARGHRAARLEVHRADRDRDLERRSAIGPRRVAGGGRGGG